MRTHDRRPRLRLAEKLDISVDQLSELVFGGESGLAAQSGKIPIAEHWRTVGARLGLEPEALPEFRREFFAGDVLDSELVNALTALRPRYQTVLISNAFADLRETVLAPYHLDLVFDHLIISGEIGWMKPDPHIYLTALQACAAAPAEAVLVDDILKNVQGAREVGMQAILFQNTTQTLNKLQLMLNPEISHLPPRTSHLTLDP